MMNESLNHLKPTKLALNKAKTLSELFSDSKLLKDNLILDEKSYKRNKKICKQLEIDQKNEQKIDPNLDKRLKKQGIKINFFIHNYIDEILKDNLININSPEKNKNVKKPNTKRNLTVNDSNSNKNFKMKSSESDFIFKNGISSSKINTNQRKSHAVISSNFQQLYQYYDLDQELIPEIASFNSGINQNIFRASKEITERSDTKSRPNHTDPLKIEVNMSSPSQKSEKKNSNIEENNFNFTQVQKKADDNTELLVKPEISATKDSRVIKKYHPQIIDSISNDEEELENNIDFESCFFIYPEGKFKFYWDMIMICIIIYLTIIFPLNIAFSINKSYNDLEIIIDICFIIDLIVNFLVVIQSNDEKYILNHLFTYIQYLKGWFSFDFLSSIPFSLISTALPLSKTLLLMKFFKPLKIIKIFQDEKNLLNRTLNNFSNDYDFRAPVKRLINLLFNFFIFSHLLSCLWISIGHIKESWNWIYAINIQDNRNFEVYLASLYFIWTTIFTIGYGDIISTNIYERLFNILLMGVGVCLYSFTITSLSTLVLNIDSMSKKLYVNLEMAENFKANYDNLSDDLFEKIVKFLKYDSKYNNSDRFGFISELPNKTRNALLYSMYEKIISNFPFFKYGQNFKNDDFNTRIVMSMRPIRLFKGDLIIKEGEIVQEMILVKNGLLSGHIFHNKIFELGRNDYFGDVLVLGNRRSPVDILVKSKVCEMFIIKKQELVQIWKDFPAIFDEILKVSSENFNRIEMMVDLAKKSIINPTQIVGSSPPPNKKSSINSPKKVSRKSVLIDEFKLNVIHEENEDTIVDEKSELKECFRMNKTEISKQTEKRTISVNRETSSHKNQLLKEGVNEIFLKDFSHRTSQIENSEDSNTSFEKEEIEDSFRSKRVFKKLKIIKNEYFEITCLYDRNLTTGIFLNKNYTSKSRTYHSNKLPRNKSVKSINVNNKSVKRLNSLSSIYSKINKDQDLSPSKAFDSPEVNSKKKKRIRSYSTLHYPAFKSGEKLRNYENEKYDSDFNKSISDSNTGSKYFIDKSLIEKSKYMMLLSKRRNDKLIEEVNQHLKENLHVELDPFSFMMKEIGKIERKVIHSKKNEMKTVLEKLDDILEKIKSMNQT